MAMIPERMKFLSVVDGRVASFILSMVQREDLIKWAREDEVRELRKDNTEYVSQSFGEKCWELISVFTP